MAQILFQNDNLSNILENSTLLCLSYDGALHSDVSLQSEMFATLDI